MAARSRGLSNPILRARGSPPAAGRPTKGDGSSPWRSRRSQCWGLGAGVVVPRTPAGASASDPRSSGALLGGAASPPRGPLRAPGDGSGGPRRRGHTKDAGVPPVRDWCRASRRRVRSRAPATVPVDHRCSRAVACHGLASVWCLLAPAREASCARPSGEAAVPGGGRAST